MTPLPTQFTKWDGNQKWVHTQQFRDGLLAIYHRCRPGGALYHYEAIIIQESEGGKAMVAGEEVEFEAKELYPSSEQWGSHGWTYDTLLEAINRIERIQKDRQDRAEKLVRVPASALLIAK